MDLENQTRAEDDRRAFLKNCGRFAVITPPAVTFLLSTSMSSRAIASSGRGNPDGAFGLLGAGAGAAGIVVAAPDERAAPQELVAPGEAPPPLAPPEPAPPPPPPMSSSLGERG